MLAAYLGHVSDQGSGVEESAQHSANSSEPKAFARRLTLMSADWKTSTAPRRHRRASTIYPEGSLFNIVRHRNGERLSTAVCWPMSISILRLKYFYDQSCLLPH